jgi:chorismate mutase
MYFVYKQKGEVKMSEENKYFVVKKKALPEVLLKVVDAKKILDSERTISVQEATDRVGISRSSFYKYKDDIFPFHDNARGKKITFMIQMEDTPGLLAVVLKKIAAYDANILTIHQTIPVNGIASLTLSIDVLPSSGDMSDMIDEIEAQEGIHYLKILARE